MASPATSPGNVYQTALESYLVSMARTVESSVSRALEALLSSNEEIASGVFVTEPRINEMEIIIDDHAVRQLRGGNLPEDEVRHIVATLKINNDLERMGDLAVNIASASSPFPKCPVLSPQPNLNRWPLPCAPWSVVASAP